MMEQKARKTIIGKNRDENIGLKSSFVCRKMSMQLQRI